MRNKILLIFILIICLLVGCKDNSKTEVMNDKEKDMPDVRGQVTSIYGNDVTLEAMVITDMKSNRKQSQSSQSSEKLVGGSIQKRELKTETLELIIPVGVPLVEISYNESEIKEEEIDLKNIKKGDTLQIWYDNKEDKNIVKVARSNMQNSAMPNGMGGMGGMRGMMPGGGLGGAKGGTK